jgi:very-short-patch-repair endonuclease
MVTAVKPCWMASPLAVSQLLGGPEQLFDVVVFDEASQVLPEDAVTSILRGRSVVVAGDPNQLPPTQFFAAERDEDSEPGEETEGFESILDVMLAFLPQWTLDWHYRSRDERLIAFSNHYVYDDRLVTFPSASLDDPALSHVLVAQAAGSDREELSSSAEVARVTQLIVEHATTRPDESLGVIAMGIRHSNRIDAELARIRRGRPELDAFFDAHPEEKFFIKNLERVQGDERDAIILSIGYGKDSSGKLPYRFGPLLTEGGFRRLNVAVTRAKKRASLVSSFSHMDMEPGRSSKRGVEMLRQYLQYASTGGEVFGDGGPSPVERNEFEIQVQTALERAGLRIAPQFGASRYRIDMAVQHPDQPGRCVLAVECDGATYHSSPTARDRDRLRQEHLEARGWRFVRIWSTDWFTRRDEEITRVLEAYQKAVENGRPQAPNVDRPSAATPGPARSSVARSARGQRPHVPRNQPITEYSIRQRADLAGWIRSDGRLRTDEEMVEAMMAELGFERRGKRIEAALREAIQIGR